MVTAKAKGRRKDRYLELVRAFPLRPIRDDEACRQAKRALRGLQQDHSDDARDYKQVLVKLISDYERHAGYALDTSNVSPAEIVGHLLEERGMSLNALAKAIGVSQGTLSETLSGRRGWSKSTILKVSDYFALNPVLFLRS